MDKHRRLMHRDTKNRTPEGPIGGGRWSPRADEDNGAPSIPPPPADDKGASQAAAPGGPIGGGRWN
eukprot:9477367-Pyramimonas_sp.AAC.1